MARGKILVVDDDEAIRGFLKDYFEDRDYNVVLARDGEDGLEIIAKETFDLVICDMMMPRMIGLQFMEGVKKTRPGQRLIFLTGVHEPSMIKKATDLGCRFYLFKPVSLAELEAKVSECFAS